jgi:hypothetical protein
VWRWSLLVFWTESGGPSLRRDGLSVIKPPIIRSTFVYAPPARCRPPSIKWQSEWLIRLREDAGWRIVREMEFSPETIFISYSRTDGREFAEAFEQRLEHEAGIKSWRDLKSVEGGEDIRPQVLRAIERVKHLVLILSRLALVSDWVKREWTHARVVGRKVSPILADPSIKRGELPGWIRRADVYDIAEPERWRMLVHVSSEIGRSQPGRRAMKSSRPRWPSS